MWGAFKSVDQILKVFYREQLPPHPFPLHGPPLLGIGGMGRTGPTLKGIAPVLRLGAESCRSVVELPQNGHVGQSSDEEAISSKLWEHAVQ